MNTLSILGNFIAENNFQAIGIVGSFQSIGNYSMHKVYSFTQGDKYYISVDVLNRTAGSICISVGGTLTDWISSNGTNEIFNIIAGQEDKITVYRSSDFDGQIDNLTVRPYANPTTEMLINTISNISTNYTIDKDTQSSMVFLYREHDKNAIDSVSFELSESPGLTYTVNQNYIEESTKTGISLTYRMLPRIKIN